MKILILCEEGVNRSVVLKSRLQYCGDGHDIVTLGLHRNSEETLVLLSRWADRIIVVDQTMWDSMPQGLRLHPELGPKFELWNIGPDKFPRPHNKELLAIVTRLIEEHPELKVKTTEESAP